MKATNAAWFHILNEWREKQGLKISMPAENFVGVEVDESRFGYKRIVLTTDETLTKEYIEFMKTRTIPGFHDYPDEGEIYVGGDYIEYGEDIRVYYYPYYNGDPYAGCINEACDHFNAAILDRGIPLNWPYWLQKWYFTEFNTWRWRFSSEMCDLVSLLKFKIPLRDKLKLLRNGIKGLRNNIYDAADYYTIFRGILEQSNSWHMHILVNWKILAHCSWDADDEKQLKTAIAEITKHPGCYGYSKDELEERWYDKEEVHCYCEGCQIDIDETAWLDMMVGATDWENMDWGIDFGGAT